MTTRLMAGRRVAGRIFAGMGARDLSERTLDRVDFSLLDRLLGNADPKLCLAARLAEESEGAMLVRVENPCHHIYKKIDPVALHLELLYRSQLPGSEGVFFAEMFYERLGVTSRSIVETICRGIYVIDKNNAFKTGALRR